jgi:hypothetical protein
MHLSCLESTVDTSLKSWLGLNIFSEVFHGFPKYFQTKEPDSAVSIETGYGLDGRGVGV